MKKAAKKVGVMGFILGQFTRAEGATVPAAVSATLRKFHGRRKATVTNTAQFILADGHGFLTRRGLRAERDGATVRVVAA